MNPKLEFVKAITQVLRLEANIYTMGAIEDIIERIEMKDYSRFIAYLGERDADYEKPIQNIAKGVDEFYTMKTEPTLKALASRASIVHGRIYAVVEQETEARAMEMLEESDHPFDNKYNHLDKARKETTEKLAKQEITFWLSIKFGEDGKINTDDINAINKDIGIKDFILMYSKKEEDPYRNLLNSMTKEIKKPSISEKIKDEALMSASQDTMIESSKIKQLLSRTSHAIYT